jgi:Putative adhesin
VRVRTSSGAVDAALTGRGGVDVQTGSSAITVRGARGGVIATSQSGRVTIAGAPGSAWTLSTSSSAIDIAVDRAASLSLDARSRSGSVKVEGGEVRGDVSKNRIAGTIGDDGPLVRATSGSGSILLTVGK